VSETFDVVVAGHICLDIIPSLTSRTLSFDPGKLVEVGPAVSSTGGPVSNTGMALHRLGIRTRLMGKVGTDTFGDMILRMVEAFGPNLAGGMIRVPGEVSSYSIILSPPGADRMFLHCPGCNDTFGPEDIDYGLLRSARLFHFGYPPLMRRMVLENGRELADLLRRVKETGVTTSLDMCMPDPGGCGGSANWSEVLKAALPYVDIYMPSLEETLIMSYPDKYRTYVETEGFSLPATELLSGIAGDLLALGPALVGLKLGARGLYLRSSSAGRFARFGRGRPLNESEWVGRELWSPCFGADVVGTTGAGDATIAGFVAALLRGDSPERCMTMACAVGACNVEAPDALSGIPGWEAIVSRIQGGWQRNKLPLDQEGWEEDKLEAVWRSSRDPAASAGSTGGEA
jgi:sugar/nucleoside kinase (ribokinase family)